jgi:hypothetical protein
MTTTVRRTRLWLILLVVCLTGCGCDVGCREATFTLAPTSRLPHWFDGAAKHRSQAVVTMDYLVAPGRRFAEFVMGDDTGRKPTRVIGEMRGDQPTIIAGPTTASEGIGRFYPSYEVITVGGVVDVVEHRRMEPVFYMVDDEAVFKKPGVPVPGTPTR